MLRNQSVRVLRIFVVAALACVALSGCLSAKMYVDPGLKSLSKTDLKPVSDPHPVQVLFEFQNKGVPNAKATALLKPRVIVDANESGLFSNASPDAGSTDEGTLKIVINNVPLSNHAAAKGFGTGLTLGLAGSMVKDGYICTATYTHDGKSTSAVVKHAIYTTIGNHSAPMGLKPMDPQAAIFLVTDQMAWNALKKLDDEHAF